MDDYPYIKEGKWVKENYALSCKGDQFFCQQCAKQYFEETVKAMNVPIKCFCRSCNGSYSTTTVKMVLNDQTMFSTYEKILNNKKLLEMKAKNPLFRICPSCGQYGVSAGERQTLDCGECSETWCSSCDRIGGHEGHGCLWITDHSVESVRRFVNDHLSKSMFQSCPTCSKIVVKDYGCNLMHCVCGTPFCYVCGVKCPTVRVEDKILHYEHFNRRGATCSLYNDQTGNTVDQGNRQFHEKNKEKVLLAIYKENEKNGKVKMVLKPILKENNIKIKSDTCSIQ
jgi:hypothetical protein